MLRPFLAPARFSSLLRWRSPGSACSGWGGVLAWGPSQPELSPCTSTGEMHSLTTSNWLRIRCGTVPRVHNPPSSRKALLCSECFLSYSLLLAGWLYSTLLPRTRSIIAAMPERWPSNPVIYTRGRDETQLGSLLCCSP